MVAAPIVAALAGPASAQPRDRLAVARLEVSVEPGVGPERAARLRANLLGGFAAIGWTVIPEEEVKASLPDPSLQWCQSDACFKALGEASKAQWVLTGTISNSASTSFNADLRIIDVTTGRSVASYSNSCGVCIVKEANDWLALVAADLRQQALASRPQPKPEPLSGQPALTSSAVETPTTKQWLLRGGGIAAGVLGIAGIVFGFVEVGRDTNTCGAVPADGMCVRHRDTANGQIFGFVTGFPLLAAGAVMSYFGWRHPVKHVAIAPTLSSHSVMLSAGWKF